MIAGLSFLDAARLVLEIVKTRPWTLARSFSLDRCKKERGGRPLDFEMLEVTSNLALALRYLRWTSKSRTLWIDSLCINQDDEVEKMTHIQHMDLIYANASPVVIWLGGYHGLGEEHMCSGSSFQHGVGCEHRHQIAAAFHHIWTRSGWRMFFRWYFNREEKTRFQESRTGLCEIAKRDWWQRLWVIQEVALATGSIQIQCGHNTCEYGDFDCGKYEIYLRYSEDRELQDVFGPSEQFRTTIKFCRYSSFHDREGMITKGMSFIMSKVILRHGREPDDGVRDFHQQLYPHRLQRILLRTAGRFKCRDDRDRLFAVLGIAAGSKTGEVTMTGRMIEILSSQTTQTIFMQQFHQLLGGSLSDFWYGGPKRTITIVGICLAVSWACWGIFYDSISRNWTISRPYYAVEKSREVIGGATGKSGVRLSKVELFITVARYLAEETETLFFLDAVNCDDDPDDEMPSWVPNWSRKVGKSARFFTNRLKEEHATARFAFTERGRTLQVDGRPSRVIKVIKPTDLDMFRSGPWVGALEKLLVMPSEARTIVARSLELLGKLATIMPLCVLNERERDQVFPLFYGIVGVLNRWLEKLEGGGTAIICNRDGMDSEIGFLRSGKANKGDRILFVPGCYHRLVVTGRRNSLRDWNIVGLVEMKSEEGQGHACSKDEWQQLIKEKVVLRFNIV